jgi:hypothetical protein
MTRTELIIQILKVVIGLAFGAYFVWWSLQVLDRLAPEYDGATAMVGRIGGSFSFDGCVSSDLTGGWDILLYEKV